MIDKEFLIGKVAIRVGPHTSMEVGDLYLIKRYTYEEELVQCDVVDLVALEDNIIEAFHVSHFDNESPDQKFRVLSEVEIAKLKEILK